MRYWDTALNLRIIKNAEIFSQIFTFVAQKIQETIFVQARGNFNPTLLQAEEALDLTFVDL